MDDDGEPVVRLGRQPDGSWLDRRDGVLIFLDAETNGKVDAFAELARANEPDITARVRATVRHLQSTCPALVLIGPDEGVHLKSVRSVKRKVFVKTRGRHPHSADRVLRRRVRDAIRYTFEIPEDGYAVTVTAAYRALSGSFVCIKWKNTWMAGGYRGINSSWLQERSGQGFEIQFHTAQSCRVERSDHELHVRELLARVAEGHVGVGAIRAELAADYAGLTVPGGATQLIFPVAQGF